MLTLVRNILATLADAETKAARTEEAWQENTLSLLALWNDHCDRCEPCENFSKCKPCGYRCNQGAAIWHRLTRQLRKGEA